MGGASETPSIGWKLKQRNLASKLLTSLKTDNGVQLYISKWYSRKCNNAILQASTNFPIVNFAFCPTLFYKDTPKPPNVIYLYNLFKWFAL